MNMDVLTLRETLAKGEDTYTQFKENIHNADQLAQEMIAFSNSMGGTIIIGVTDKGEIKGLTDEDIRRLNQLVANASSENVKPAIFPKTAIITIENQKVLLVYIPYGVNKPYCTNKGVYYTKSGSDKRKVSQDELRRLFQESGKLYADEMIFKNADFRDIDLELFKQFHEKRNHTLASFAFDLIPYRGIGSGIIRVLQHYPDIEFIDDVEIEQFKAIIKRPVME